MNHLVNTYRTNEKKINIHKMKNAKGSWGIFGGLSIILAQW